ncbi:MAG: transcription initiation factor subunit alpha [Candidatus Diapherotrites archaeon]|nr:transcription initiation factor subunit alpha [Candidatus Diapherotrites archaeon]MDN5366869.1 transcription initiation factor subunit alpha [Candidatus Diapherotrites archaeon]
MDPILQLIELPFVAEYLQRIGGENALTVMKLMVEMGNAVTDEQVAEKMGVKVTVVRAVFNRLHYWGIADYTKEQNPETGWWTYTWFLVKDKIKEAVIGELEERESELRQKREELDQFMFFVCPEGHVREPFEVAMEYDFRCPACGAELQPLDVEEEKKKIDEQLDQIWRAKKILNEI